MIKSILHGVREYMNVQAISFSGIFMIIYNETIMKGLNLFSFVSDSNPSLLLAKSKVKAKTIQLRFK